MATSAVSLENTGVNQSSPENADDVGDDVVAPMHPSDFGGIPMPKHLSPSSAMEFKECPQSYLFQYLYKLSQPTNAALARGSMTHGALEHIFDLDPPDRSLENLQNMLRATWGDHRLKDGYRALFETEDGGRDVDAEREWGRSALRLLENYYRSEDPRTVVRPNPYRREVWVNADLTVDPSLGVTGKGGGPARSSSSSPHETFKVRGIVDRLDMVKVSSRKVALKIVDYKTGKAPNLKYSDAMNKKIYQKNFYQLKIYALLMREKEAAKQREREAAKNVDDSYDPDGSDGTTSGLDLRFLKLYYLDSESGRAQPWEMDLGETQEERDEALSEVHQDLAQIWTDIAALVATQDPKSFVHCDRSFCYCHRCRERFVPGSVWEKPNEAS